MSVDDQIDELQRELNAKDAEIDRLRAIQPCCGSRFWQVGPVSKSEPAFMLVYLPFPSMGVTVATLDKAGNLVVKVDQPAEPEPPKPHRGTELK